MKAGITKILATTFLLVFAGAAIAQEYPTRRISFVVPFGVGAGADLAARYVAQEVSKILKVPVIVENKPGADGIIATNHVKTSPADGYTVLIGANTTHVINPNIYRTLSYDAVKDFTPVSRMVRIPYVLVTRPGLKVKTVKELLALAKQRSEKERLTFGSGNGSSWVGAALLASASGVPDKFVRVTYPGPAQAFIDIIADRVDFMFADLASSLPYVKNNQAVAIAVVGDGRLPEMPDVPTLEESGIRMDLVGWIAAFVSSGTSPKIVDTLNAAFVQVLNAPDTKTYFGRIGLSPWPSTSDQMRDYVIQEIKAWAYYIDMAGMEKK